MLQAINAHNARNEGKVLIICHNARPRCGLAKLAHSWRREIDGESVTVFTGAAWGDKLKAIVLPVARQSKLAMFSLISRGRLFRVVMQRTNCRRIIHYGMRLRPSRIAGNNAR